MEHPSHQRPGPEIEIREAGTRQDDHGAPSYSIPVRIAKDSRVVEDVDGPSVNAPTKTIHAARPVPEQWHLLQPRVFVSDLLRRGEVRQSHAMTHVREVARVGRLARLKPPEDDNSGDRTEDRERPGIVQGP